jgi:hypothetical protein
VTSLTELLIERAVWPVVVVVVDGFAEHDVELASVEDQHSAEKFTTDRADETFYEGIGPWGTDWRADDPDALTRIGRRRRSRS